LSSDETKVQSGGTVQAKVEVVARVAEVPASAWDACANPDPATFNPFVAHAFLKALEDAGTVGGRTGWAPRHLLLRGESGEVLGCAPCYLKSHSQGEYIFDYGWADAYMQAGGRYYPKMQIAVPFTPVPGPRLLIRPGPASETYEAVLAAAAMEIAELSGLSGVHIPS
jgi:predicted N-acyltransferase